MIFHLTFRTHDASEPNPRDHLLSGACHPVKGRNDEAQIAISFQIINPLFSMSLPTYSGSALLCDGSCTNKPYYNIDNSFVVLMEDLF
jgi:hypothetical protein